jgi:hypothetical protein
MSFMPLGHPVSFQPMGGSCHEPSRPLRRNYFSLFDAFMNLITLGIWNTIRGEQHPNLKVKK